MPHYGPEPERLERLGQFLTTSAQHGSGRLEWALARIKQPDLVTFRIRIEELRRVAAEADKAKGNAA